MKYLVLITLIFCSPLFAKEMNTATKHYSFATKAIDSLGSTVADCDSYAVQDNEIEWMCSSYDQGYKNFMDSWEILAQSFGNQLIPHSDWSLFYNADHSIDFYGKTYYLDGTEMLVAFDLSEKGREIFIGINPKVFSLIVGADTYIKTIPNIQRTTSLQSNTNGNYDCKNFSSQAEAIQFFTSNGFNSDNDPYNLDADNNGIPCEFFQNNSSYSNQCSTNESWVNSYVRKNGTKVKGHCRKRR